ncbi:hypothetical protein GF402_06450 [Candidatus Fermentibacteria bacterium]|nr:hypothetical protein [Candidatus Fermentibacteria bacterium]
MGLAALAVLTLTASFADQLYERGDYHLAALEYSRLIYTRGDTLERSSEALRLARCWQRLDELERSLSLYSYLADRLPDGDDRAMAALGAGSVCAEIGFYGRSRAFYHQAAKSAVTEDLVFRGQLLGSLALLYQERWEGSSAELRQVAADWPGERGRLAEELAGMAESGSELPYRSPLWCGLASTVLPGSGQLICGHTTDGLTALGMNAAAGALFYLSLDEDNTATSILLGWLSLSFYGGNIYGGVRAADYYNTAQRRHLYEDVRARLSGWEE